jgi:hypothetical protein
MPASTREALLSLTMQLHLEQRVATKKLVHCGYAMARQTHHEAYRVKDRK